MELNFLMGRAISKIPRAGGVIMSQYGTLGSRGIDQHYPKRGFLYSLFHCQPSPLMQSSSLFGCALFVQNKKCRFYIRVWKWQLKFPLNFQRAPSQIRPTRKTSAAPMCGAAVALKLCTGDGTRTGAYVACFFFSKFSQAISTLLSWWSIREF